MALQTLPEPRKVARDLFGLGLARATLWTALLLLVVLATAFSVLTDLLFPTDTKMFGPVMSSPITMGLLEAWFMFGLAWGIFAIGRLFGGQGTLEQAITTVIWMEFLFLGLQIGTVILSLFAPGLALILMMASMFIFFWVLSHFTAESHGFQSTGLVFAGILTFLILAVFALSFVLVLAGVEPVTLPVAN